MPKPPTRTFLLTDAMALVAATAAGFFFVQLSLHKHSQRLFWLSIQNARTSAALASNLIVTTTSIALPLLFAWMLALLALRLCRPRPSLRRLARQPGTVACAVGTLALAIGIAFNLTQWAVGSRFFHAEGIFLTQAQHACFATLGGWMTLAMTGRWRPEPSWIDRAGRAVGFAWIVATLVLWSRYFLL